MNAEYYRQMEAIAQRLEQDYLYQEVERQRRRSEVKQRNAARHEKWLDETAYWHVFYNTNNGTTLLVPIQPGKGQPSEVRAYHYLHCIVSGGRRRAERVEEYIAVQSIEILIQYNSRKAYDPATHWFGRALAYADRRVSYAA